MPKKTALGVIKALNLLQTKGTRSIVDAIVLLRLGTSTKSEQTPRAIGRSIPRVPYATVRASLERLHRLGLLYKRRKPCALFSIGAEGEELHRSLSRDLTLGSMLAVYDVGLDTARQVTILLAIHRAFGSNESFAGVLSKSSNGVKGVDRAVFVRMEARRFITSEGRPKRYKLLPTGNRTVDELLR